MNLRYFKLALIGLALVLFLQGCFVLPPPSYHHHHRHDQHRHGYLLEQSPKPVAQLTIQNGGEFSDRGEVAH